MSKGINLSECGWVWDGQAVNGQWDLSIFGAGEGTRWFGLRKCCHMFHRNSDLAMEKLSWLDEVVCDISKWDYAKVEHPDYPDIASPMRAVHDGSLERKIIEADKVGRLSIKHPNISGVFDDDLFGKITDEEITPAEYARVKSAAKEHNPDLKLWGVVYGRELEHANWSGFSELIDVVNLWIWNSADLFRLDEYVTKCEGVFPGVPIMMGCYLRDFTIMDGVPFDRLKHQWESMLGYIGEGRIAGYTILGGFLIELHEPQAKWVRDFIAANSGK